MNKFLTNTNGGLPFKLDDIRFEQNAYRTAFADLISIIDTSGSNGCILSGCVVTKTGTAPAVTYNWTQGAIAMDGEIFNVPAGNAVFTEDVTKRVYWQVKQTFDPTGNKQFKNGLMHDTYAVRTLELVELLYDSTKTLYDTKTIKQRLNDYYVSFNQNDWDTDNYNGGWRNGWTNKSANDGSKLRFKINGGGIHLKGRIRKTQLNSGEEEIYVFASNLYTPSVMQIVTAYDMNNFGAAYPLLLTTTGSLKTQNGPYGNPMDLWIPDQLIQKN